MPQPGAGVSLPLAADDLDIVCSKTTVTRFDTTSHKAIGRRSTEVCIAADDSVPGPLPHDIQPLDVQLEESSDEIY